MLLGPAANKLSVDFMHASGQLVPMSLRDLAHVKLESPSESRHTVIHVHLLEFEHYLLRHSILVILLHFDRALSYTFLFLYLL